MPDSMYILFKIGGKVVQMSDLHQCSKNEAGILITFYSAFSVFLSLEFDLNFSFLSVSKCMFEGVRNEFLNIRRKIKCFKSATLIHFFMDQRHRGASKSG
jgi:hypothetical protein